MGLSSRLVIFMFLLFGYMSAFSQGKRDGQNSSRAIAQRMFAEGKYAVAAQYLSQLLSVDPNDSLMNYEYGVCLLITESDKAKCIPFLEAAVVAKLSEPDLYFFMGRAYHLNERFNEALNAYREYDRRAQRKDAERREIDLQIQTVQNAKASENTTSVPVKTDMAPVSYLAFYKEIPRRSFLSAYEDSTLGGKILPKPDICKLSADLVRGDSSYIFLSKNLNVIYLSSYGDNGDRGRDIYVMTKLRADKWSSPKNLGNDINTQFDEDYPFITKDGKTLYFCSKGHNSIGGYDIFKSVFNSVTNSWSPPENMGAPVNSTADDLLYVTDGKGNATFTSLRSSGADMVGYYKFVTAKNIASSVDLDGYFNSESRDAPKKATISLLSADDHRVLQELETDPETGAYQFKMQAGQNYMIVVQKKGYIPHSELFTVPVQNVKHNIGQQLYLKKNASGEDLTVSNYFSLLMNNSDFLNSTKTEEILSNFRFGKGAYSDKLISVNLTEGMIRATPPGSYRTAFNIPAEPNTQEIGSNPRYTSDLPVDSVYENRSVNSAPIDTMQAQTREEIAFHNQLISAAYEFARNADKQAREMETMWQIADLAASKLDSIARSLESEAKRLIAEANKEMNIVRKNYLLELAHSKQSMAAAKRHEAKAAISLANQYNSTSQELRKDAEATKTKAKSAEKNPGSISRSDSVGGSGNSLNALSTKTAETIAKAQELRSGTAMIDRASYNIEEARKLKAQAEELESEAKELTSKARETTLKAGNTSGEERIHLNNEAAEMTNQSKQKIAEAQTLYATAAQLQDSAEYQRASGLLAQNIVQQADSLQNRMDREVSSGVPNWTNINTEQLIGGTKQDQQVPNTNLPKTKEPGSTTV